MQKWTEGIGLDIVAVVRVMAPPKVTPGAGPDLKISPTNDIVVAVVTSASMLALVAGISLVRKLDEVRLDASINSGLVVVMTTPSVVRLFVVLVAG